MYATPTYGTMESWMCEFTKYVRTVIERFDASLTRGICTRTASGVRSGSIDDADGATNQNGRVAFTVKFPYSRV